MRSSRKLVRARKRKLSRKNMRGGTWYGLASGPVGCSWKGNNPSSWPGVSGKVGQSNYYQLSPNGSPTGYFDPAVSSSNIMKMKGGRKKTKYKIKKKGKGKKIKYGKSNKRKKKGGCACASIPMTGGSGLVRNRFFPADFVNAYRSVVNAPSKWMNDWSGKSQPANLNSSPTHQPIDNMKVPEFQVGSRISPGQTSTSAKNYVTSTV